MTAAAPLATAIQPESLLPRLRAAAGRINLQILAECDSTNLRLLEMARKGAPAGTVLLTERQSAGRGRRGRVWHHGPQALAFSLLWRLPPDCPPNGLSLAVGLAVAEALSALPTVAASATNSVLLKWPNDILIAGRKVAGILIESVASPTAGSLYVIGIGLNLGNLDTLPSELAEIASGIDVDDREHCFAQVLDHLVTVLDEFAAHGFAVLQTRWQNRHAYQDMAVNLFFSEGGEPLQGVCRGVDSRGELLIETATCIQTIASGEVSLRLQ